MLWKIYQNHKAKCGTKRMKKHVKSQIWEPAQIFICKDNVKTKKIFCCPQHLLDKLPIGINDNHPLPDVTDGTT